MNNQPHSPKDHTIRDPNDWYNDYSECSFWHRPKVGKEYFFYKDAKMDIKPEGKSLGYKIETFWKDWCNVLESIYQNYKNK